MSDFPEGDDELRPEDFAALDAATKVAVEPAPRYQSPPLPDEEAEPEEVEPEPEASIHGFPLQVRDDVDGLMWLGYLEDTFSFGHHTFTIRTLRGEEELLAGVVTKKYVDIIGRDKAWAWAQVSLSLVAVDGDAYFCPMMGPDKEAYAEARFKWVTSRWFWPVGAFIITRYAELLQRQADAIDALQDLS